MGYTHYYRFNSKRGDSTKNEIAYKKAVKDCNRIIQYYSKTFGGLSGYSAHSKNYGGIKVNGSERVGQCEDLVLRERLSQNDAFNFCKTIQYPYDTVVTACLIMLQHRLKGAVVVSSDGRPEDWANGLNLARLVTGLKTIQIPKRVSKGE